MGPDKIGAEILRKAEKLGRLLQGSGGAVIAFSGGVDSTYLLYRALQSRGVESVLAVTAVSPLQAPGEAAEAKKIARFLGANHLILPFKILDREEFLLNTRQRCYYCKCHLFDCLLEIAARYRLPTVWEGANLDDAGEYRPGLTAARERAVESPLMEVGLTKREIRRLSRAGGLPTWDRAASPCLATRFPYGERLEREKLRLVARAERYLKGLGFRGELRVRYHGKVARIEVPVQEQVVLLARRELGAAGKKRLGFEHVTLDLVGFQSGGFDREPPR